MRAPGDQTRPDGKIIREAVALLKDGKAKTVRKTARRTRVRPFDDPLANEAAEWAKDIDFTALYVQGELAHLRVLDQKRTSRGTLKEHLPLWGHKTENADTIVALRARIEDMQKALSEVPSTILVKLFAYESDAESADIPSDAVQQKTLARICALVSTMERLRARCGELLKAKPGVHKSTDHRQHLAAEGAFRLMRSVGLVPASGVLTSVYGKLASLLCEGLTGEHNVDLYPVCRNVLEADKKGHPPPDYKICSPPRRLPKSI